METLGSLIDTLGLFIVGVFARLGLFLGMVLVLLLPALALAALLRLREARRERSLGIRGVGGVPFRPDLAYAPGHVWLRRRKGGAALELGLDGLAQRLLTGVSAVEAVRGGTRVRKGEPIVTLHGGGRALRIPAPFDGMVLGVNAAAVRDPALVKREGYGRGWLVLFAADGDAGAGLPSGDAAESWMKREAQRWNHFLEDRLGFAAADGGELIAPAPWLIGEEGWRALAAAFLEP